MLFNIWIFEKNIHKDGILLFCTREGQAFSLGLVQSLRYLSEKAGESSFHLGRTQGLPGMSRYVTIKVPPLPVTLPPYLPSPPPPLLPGWLTHSWAGHQGFSASTPTIKALHWNSPAVDSAQAVGKHRIYRNLARGPTTKILPRSFHDCFGCYKNVKTKTEFIFRCQSNSHSYTGCFVTGTPLKNSKYK